MFGIWPRGKNPLSRKFYHAMEAGSGRLHEVLGDFAMNRLLCRIKWPNRPPAYGFGSRHK